MIERRGGSRPAFTLDQAPQARSPSARSFGAARRGLSCPLLALLCTPVQPVHRRGYTVLMNCADVTMCNPQGSEPSSVHAAQVRSSRSRAREAAASPEVVEALRQQLRASEAELRRAREQVPIARLPGTGLLPTGQRSCVND